MKLIKVTDDHYVIVDDSEIKEGDWYVGLHNKVIKATDGKHYAAEAVRFSGKPVCKITHSTQPLEYSSKIGKYWGMVQPIELSKVKELIGEVDVEKKAEYDWMLHTEGSIVVTDKNDWKSGFHHGYKQAIEDNKGKKYTEEDMIDFSTWRNITCFGQNKPITSKWEFELWKSLQFPTQWDVEFDSQYKLKLI